jgi:hypothetical protein
MEITPGDDRRRDDESNAHEFHRGLISRFNAGNGASNGLAQANASH